MIVKDLQFIQTEIVKFTRPGANDGLWSMFLLPIALITSAYNNQVILSETYKTLPFISIGFVLSNCVIILKLRKFEVPFINCGLFIIITVLHFILSGRIVLSTLVGFTVFFYFFTYRILLKKFPKCFTLGEAAITSQSFVLVVVTSLLQIKNVSFKRLHSYTLIIQLELLAILLLALFIHYFNVTKNYTIYLSSVIILLAAFIIPLHVILNQNPILIVLNHVFGDVTTLTLVLYWVMCCCLAVLAIAFQIRKAQKATTTTRKIFHVLAVAVYIPGLIYDCQFLYVASGILLGVFFLIEILRIKNVPPLGTVLQDGFSVYCDEKDAGVLALTPIYLLVACSMPMWIHPGPCDVTNTTFFNLLPLLSGIMTIGIGDTFASIVGSKYGLHKWSGSAKSVEGTLACILGQAGMIYLLNNLGYLHLQNSFIMLRLGFAILLTSYLEAKTDQVDNLVLPFVMYIILV